MRLNLLHALVLLSLISIAEAQPPQWTEGKNYFAVEPAQPTHVSPGKIEVTEVFSYACPACNRFNPYMERLQKSLPTNAMIDYIAAAFIPTEDWPVFQRAYYTAKFLGIAEKTHDAMFDAVWKSNKLAIIDQNRKRLKTPLPRIEDVAEWYHEQTGIPIQTFLSAAHSGQVNFLVRQANSYITALQINATPTIIVDDRYRVDPVSAGNYSKMVALVKWLVVRRTQRRPLGVHTP